MRLENTKNLERICHQAFDKFNQVKTSGPLALGDQQFHDVVQKFVIFQTNDRVFNDIIKPILMRNLYEAEGKSAGSAELFIHLLSLYFNVNRRHLIEETDFRQLSDVLSRLSKIKSTKNETFLGLERIEDTQIKGLIEEVWSNMDRDDQIDVRRLHTDKTSVNKDLGYNFTDVKIDGSFVIDKNWNRKNVNMILIDGVIERASHVEKILMISNEKKEPFVVICRDATEEVKAAFINNFLRKTTDSVLITAPYSEKTAHIFNDLKVVSNCDVVSPELGDIITAQVYKKSKSVEKVSVTKDGLKVYNLECHNNVINHRENLQNQLNSTVEEQVLDLLRKRIKTLSGSTISIKIGDDLIMRNRSCIEKIDKTLRQMKDFLKTGVLGRHNQDLVIEVQKLELTNRLPISISSLKTAIDQFVSFREIFSSSGFIILED